MKRLFCVLLTLSLLLSGCAQKEPSQEELSAFFKDYVYASYAGSPNFINDPDAQDKIHYIGGQDHYACVYAQSVGVDLLIWDITVYRFDYRDGQILVEACAEGDEPISGGLSVNHVEEEGRHIYFGAVSDYHWVPDDDSTLPIEWLTLRFTDADGRSVDMDMSGKLGYLCILDAPFADFQVIDQGGNICLDYATYLEQGYPIEEAAFASIS